MGEQNQYRRTESRAERIRRVKRNRRILLLVVIGIIAAIVAAIVLGRGRMSSAGRPGNLVNLGEGCPPLDVQLLTPNEYSRPQTPLEQVGGIVVHYTANPGSSAQANRNYFEGLKDGTDGVSASSHFIIGLDGEIIQCIPTAEVSYASNDRNFDTISIECCHPDESGQFTDDTYQSLVELTAWLCNRFQLSSEDVIRHYDVTGKECPKYFVDHEDAWEQFRNDVQKQIDKL